LMASSHLWSLYHKAEQWLQQRLIIQDCCIPLAQAASFLVQVLKDPGTFPIWLCPLQGTSTPQFLAPHYGHSHLMNFGIYGICSYAASMTAIIRELEQQTHLHEGRKVLYSLSSYSESEFWKIYPQKEYKKLQQKTHAKGVWRELTEKVLSN